MVQEIKLYRSTATAIVPGTTSLAYGKPAYTNIGGVNRFYVGDSGGLAREIAGDAYAKLAGPTFTGTVGVPTNAPLAGGAVAASQAYVDAAVAAGVTPTSFDFKDSVRVASNANIADLSAVTVANFDGTGQGVTLVAGNRVLINNPASIDGVEPVSAKRKGIYVVGTVAGPVAPLTRSTDADTSAEVTNGMTVANVDSGTFSGYRFVLTTSDPIVLDTTALTFAAQPNAGLTAGDGIDFSGSVVSVDVSALVGSGVEDDGSNNFRVKADVTTGATVVQVAVSANGVGVTLDNASIVHTAGVLSVGTVDGGTF
jgi:hypothetical protein